MSNRNQAEWWQDLYDLDEDIPQQSHRLYVAPKNRSLMPKEDLEQAALAEFDNLDGFEFTYHAKLHEQAWITNSLGSFYSHKWIDDVLRLVKGGKEATVYLCESSIKGEKQLTAGKVYRPRMFRNLKKDHLYREGREELDAGGSRIYDERMFKAMRKHTALGRDIMHTSWVEHEFSTLQRLFAAGVDVPQPHVSDNNAILMDYVGDEGMPAPPLSYIHLDRDEAESLFVRVLHNIELMLAHDRIHADLSAYNILYWDGDIWLIDFPQAIEPEANPSSYRIFERDVTRVCEYFARQGVKSQPHRLAADLWTAYRHRLTPEVDPAYLDSEDENDVTFWKANQS